MQGHGLLGVWKCPEAPWLESIHETGLPVVPDISRIWRKHHIESSHFLSYLNSTRLVETFRKCHY